MAVMKLHPGQSQVMRYLFPRQGEVFIPTVRYAAVCASRGFGKSVLAGGAASTAVKYLTSLPRDVPNKNVSIIAPTYGQVTDIYWPILAHMYGLQRHAVKFSKADGYFEFRGNVTLRLWSYEASERMRGSGQFLIIGDEVTTWEGNPGLRESWESIIQPTMVTRWPGNHRALIISTPKGFDYFHDMYGMENIDPERWKSFHYDYRRSPYLSPEEVERVRKTIDPIKFAREYLARFEDSGSNVFYMFSKDNIAHDLPDLMQGETVHVSVDFNIGIMACTVWAIRGDQMHAIGEFQGLPDTTALARRLKLTFPNRKIIAYPDPAGKARKTNSVTGQTDFAILEAHGITCLARNAHPALVDSAAAVNAKLKNSDGEVTMFLCPNRAPMTIRSLQRTQWVEKNPNTATIDKRNGEEHFSDGVRYITEMLFPVKNHKSAVAKGFGF